MASGLLARCEGGEEAAAPAPVTPPAPVVAAPPARSKLPSEDALLERIAASESFAKAEALLSTHARVRRGQEKAQAFAAAQGEPRAHVALVSVRMGYPVYSVSPQPGETRWLLGIDGERVLLGKEAFWTLCRELADEAPSLAAAYVMLYLGLPREPHGPWSNPVAEPPRWTPKGLQLRYTDEQGRARKVVLRLDCTAKTVDESTLPLP